MDYLVGVYNRYCLGNDLIIGARLYHRGTSLLVESRKNKSRANFTKLVYNVATMNLAANIPCLCTFGESSPMR